MFSVRMAMLAVVLTVPTAFAQEDPAEPISPAVRRVAVELRDRAHRGTEAFSIVRSLATEVGPRPAGSRGDRMAVAWALAKLRELGFENVRAEPVTVPHWERGTERCEIISPFPQPLHVTALGRSVGTPEEGIEAELVVAETLEELDRMAAERVHGKIVFIPQRLDRTSDGSSYGRGVQKRVHGASHAARLGAVALLIRSVGTARDRFPHTGGMTYAGDAPRIPAAALADADADLLEAAVATGKTIRVRMTLSCRTLPDAESANVIGEIRGRQHPEEIVLLGAHLDSWDLGTGAIDDGAGCAIVIEAARAIGRLPRRPRRTIRVVLFANEELGLSGAEAYGVRWDVDRHVLAIESDFGSGRALTLSTRVTPSDLPLVDELMALLHPLGIGRGDDDSEGGADLSPLVPCGVPIMDLGQDGTFYFDVHHTANDMLPQVDAADLDQNVAAMATIAYVGAEIDHAFDPVLP